MEQQVEVSPLNRVYTGHCVPSERSFRKKLRKKYKAKFGGYSVEQDELILRRFKTLVSEAVTEGTPREFLQSVLETCSGKNQAELHKSKSRTIAVRNIIGLYVGQVGNCSLLYQYLTLKKNTNHEDGCQILKQRTILHLLVWENLIFDFSQTKPLKIHEILLKSLKHYINMI